MASRLCRHLTGAARSFLISGNEGCPLERQLRAHALHEATNALLRDEPQYSAAKVLTSAQRWGSVAFTLCLLCLVALSPRFGGLLLTGLVAAGYLANAAFRAWLFWVGADGPSASMVRVEEGRQWPVYTVLVPLYREANVVPQLAQAMRQLDYPRDRLDVKLVVEEDDPETVAEAELAASAYAFEVIIVPCGEPRTKPRACNYALQFARGDFLVIFDAEDRPELHQLKEAVAAFRRLPEEVVCLQARLNFFNARECWLTRMFALDYALWFDFLLPGLDRLGVPMPLGGTSNHFRISALKAIHGWDPFNVTEDADLGIRLTRLGLRVRTLESTTYEEAPNETVHWVRQRTRWLKGYMQTWLVHMRNPVQLWRNAGAGGFFGFQLFVGGTVLSALLNPLLWLIFVLSFFVDLPLPIFAGATHSISGFGLLMGNALFAYLAMLGPYRRGWLDLSPYALLVPVYWLLISVAAYRALW